MALTIGELVGYLRLDRKDWSRGIEFAQRQLGHLGSAVDAVGRSGGLMMLAAQGIQVAAALAPASGVLLAIPAAAAVAVMALTTVKLATAGVGDAMKAAAEGDAKKLQEAMKGLSPQARRFVQAWAGISGLFKPIQQAVQDRFFAHLDRDVAGLATHALPGLRAGLLPTAAALNGLVREGVQAAGTPLFAGLVARVGQSTASSMQSLRGTIDPLIGTINNAAQVGLPWVERLAQMAAAGLKARLAFLSSEAGANRMASTLNRGVATMGRIVSIGGSVSAAIAGIWRAAGGGESRDTLATIESLAARMAEWVNSVAGQTTLHDWFSRLNDVGGRVVEVALQVFDVVSMLLGVMERLPAPVQDAATTALAWSIVLGPIAGKLVAVGSAVLTVVGAVGKGTAAAYRYLFAHQTAAGGTRAAWLAAKVSTIASWLAMQVAATASALRTGLVMGATATWAAAVWIGQMAAAAAATVARLAVMAGAFVVQGAVMLASVAATAAGVVAGWVLMGVQSMIQAARMAAAWFIAMGPVGWVIAAVIGLVALIVANWDTVKRITQQAWNWVWNNVIKPVWDFIVGYVRFQVNTVLAIIGWFRELPGKIAAWFGAMRDRIVSDFNRVVDFVRSIPGRLLDAVGNLKDLLVDAGKNVVEGLWNGISSMASWLASKVTSMVKATIPGPIRDALGIGSPSRVAAALTRWVPAGMAQGMRDNAAMVSRAARRLAAAALPDLPGLGTPGLALAGVGMPSSSGGGVTVNVERQYNYASQSTADVARDLAWTAAGRGRG